MFGDCGIVLPCGRCPGLCLTTDGVSHPWTPVQDDYLLSPTEWDDGERLIQIALFNDSIMGINFLHRDIVYRDTLFVFEDFNIGSVSAVYGKDSIVLLQGAYTVTYSQGANGTTLVTVISY